MPSLEVDGSAHILPYVQSLLTGYESRKIGWLKPVILGFPYSKNGTTSSPPVFLKRIFGRPFNVRSRVWELTQSEVLDKMMFLFPRSGLYMSVPCKRIVFMFLFFHIWTRSHPFQNIRWIYQPPRIPVATRISFRP